MVIILVISLIHLLVVAVLGIFTILLQLVLAIPNLLANGESVNSKIIGDVKTNSKLLLTTAKKRKKKTCTVENTT